MKEQIKDIYDGLAILLVFITILMNNSQAKAQKLIDKAIPKGKKAELEINFKTINRFMYNEWLLLFGVNLILIWILTPMARLVVKSSTIDLLHFDIPKTIYMFIYVIMWGFAIKYVLTTNKLFQHRKKYKSELRN